MNNLTIYGGERNHYYSGKALSVSSFESEQRYNNDKRRLVNRHLLGVGAACGLDVIRLGEDSVSIEPGIALDGYGREIVVPSADVKRIASLTGYNDSKKNAEYYLYIKYDEKTPAAENETSSGGLKKQYDTVLEGYFIYLSEKEPDFGREYAGYYLRMERLLFSDEYIDVYINVPRHAMAEDRFRCEIKVYVKDNVDFVSLTGNIGLKCCRYEGRDSININYSNAHPYKNEVMGITCICDSMNVSKDLVEFTIPKESFKLTYETLGKKVQKSNDSDIDLQTVLAKEDALDRIRQDYRMDVMSVAKSQSQEDICLARISIKDGSIDNVSDVRHKSILPSLKELGLENEYLKERLYVLENTGNAFGREVQSNVAKEQEFEIASGTTTIQLGIGGKTGKRFFSDEIVHNLGLGDVAVVLGLEQTAEEEQTIVYGSNEIFDEKSKNVQAELAAKVNPKTGTFMIGLRLLEPTSEYQVNVHWMAYRKKELYSKQGERHILIENSMKTLKIMESCYFEIRFVNMISDSIIWSVDGKNSGTIDENGCYTAPNVPGVYKVRAVCQSDSGVSASAYVVVRQ